MQEKYSLYRYIRRRGFSPAFCLSWANYWKDAGFEIRNNCLLKVR